MPGWVRGAGSEQIFNNANPAYNREYFNEAHDVVIACWTRPGPFRWEGKHFTYRFVNPWVAAVSEAASADLDSRRDQPGDRRLVRAASVPIHRAGHRAAIDGRVVEPLRRYRRRRRATRPGSENFGYLQQIFVAETEEKAQELGKGRALRRWRRELLASGHGPCRRATIRRRRRAVSRVRQTDYGFLGVTSAKLQERSRRATRTCTRKRAIRASGYAAARSDRGGEARKSTAITRRRRTACRSSSVRRSRCCRRLRLIMEELHPGIFGLFQAQGPLTLRASDDQYVRLLGQEVLPAMREYRQGTGNQGSVRGRARLTAVYCGHQARFAGRSRGAQACTEA